MKKLVILLLLVLPVAFMAGCESPRYRVLSPVQNNIYAGMDLNTVEQCVIAGAAKMGWGVQATPYNIVYAVYRLGEEPHRPFDENPRARDYGFDPESYTGIFEREIYVAVSYTYDSYRIEYYDSKNMGFEPESDSIYEEYLYLIKQLDRSIQAELLAAY